jgi:hypothetical protein
VPTGWQAIRASVLRELRPAGPLAFESRLNGARIHFPASAWQNARDAGLTFEQSLAKLGGHGWIVLRTLVDELGLSDVYVSSLYRATGTGPHVEGRGIDLGYLQRPGAPLVLLRRDANGEPALEPELARRTREILVRSPSVTQVLTPWWIRTKTRDGPNDGTTDLDVEHRTHLHVTTAAGQPLQPSARRRARGSGGLVKGAAAIAAALLLYKIA